MSTSWAQYTAETESFVLVHTDSLKARWELLPILVVDTVAVDRLKSGRVMVG